MALVAIGLGAYGVVVTCLLVALFFGAREMRAGERAARAREIERADKQVERLQTVLEQRDRDHAAILAQRNEQHLAEIERLNAVQTASLERLMNMQAFGTTTPKEAVVTEAEPDAETRMLRGVTEDMINHGAAVLKAEYEKRGIIVALDELRDEAHSMLLGVPFKPTLDRHLAVKD